MQDAVIMLIIMSVPLMAIGSRAWLKAKSLDSQNGGGALAARMNALEAENRDLKRRVEVLETIAVNDVRRDGIVGARALDAADSADTVRVAAEAIARR